MAKIFKWLMVMLIPLFSSTISSCDNENKDEPPKPEINERTQEWGAYTTIWGTSHGKSAQIRCISDPSEARYVDCKGIGLQTNPTMVYIPEANSINDIVKIPSTGWNNPLAYQEGGYIVQLAWNGVAYYVRCWIQGSYDASGSIIGYTIKYQDLDTP